MLKLTRRGSTPPGDSATRITGIALGPIFFAPRRGIVCLWTEISYKWHPDATLIKQNARGTAGDNRVNCNRIPGAAVYDIPPAPPGDSSWQKIALIATGLQGPAGDGRAVGLVHVTSDFGWRCRLSIYHDRFMCVCVWLYCAIIFTNVFSLSPYIYVILYIYYIYIYIYRINDFWFWFWQMIFCSRCLVPRYCLHRCFDEE